MRTSTMNARLCWSMVVGLSLAGCGSLSDLSGTLCNDGGTCGPGYTCEPSTHRCVPGVGADAGQPDAGPLDAGQPDAGPPDAGLDAGVDAGVDAGTVATLRLSGGDGGVLDFGALNLSATSAPRTFTVTNVGDQRSGSLQTQLSGATTQFQLTDGCAGTVLDGGASCVITSSFHPGASGLASASVAVSATPGGSVSGTLVGTGVDPVPVTVTFLGTGTGTVTGGATPCSGSCSVTGPRGTTLTLTAAPDASSDFVGWSGCTSTSGTTCSVLLDTSKGVSATFTLKKVNLNVTVSTIDVASGTVSVNPNNTFCGVNCWTYDYGAVVTLTAKPGAGFYLQGWKNDCVGTGLTCQVTLNGPKQVTATFTPANKVFVTSAAYSANSATPTLGVNSESNANLRCNTLAATAGFSGNFKAWLSTSTLDAADPSRFGSAAGWVRVDGKPFADTLASLTAGRIYYPPNLTESGAVMNASVWTGTFGDGTRSATNTCGDWGSTAGNSMFGYSDSGGNVWTFAATSTCVPSNTWHLYCFQVDYTASLNFAPPPTGRVMFVSASAFDTTAGVAGADALCWNDARLAGLDAGTAPTATNFQAFVSTTTASATSRVAAARGVPVSRPDGVVIATSDSALLDGGVLLQAPIEVGASTATRLLNNGFVWTGATTPKAPTSDGGSTSCLDWTSNSALRTGVVGNGNRVGWPLWFDDTNYPPKSCTAVSYGPRVYCLQK